MCLQVQEHLSCAIADLVIGNQTVSETVGAAGAVPVLLDVLETEFAANKREAARALRHLLFFNKTNGNAVLEANDGALDTHSTIYTAPSIQHRPHLRVHLDL